jgi:hypothetical protein
MQRFDAWGLAKFFGHMDKARADIAQLGSLGNPDELMSADMIKEYVFGLVVMALHHAINAKLQSTYDRVWEGGGPFWMAASTGQLTFNQAEHELVVLRQCIEADLEKRMFAFIEPHHAELFWAIEKTWQEVLAKLPDSGKDIEDAHVTYMAEVYTSTVFHMMRVAEHGLRALAKKLRISRALKHKGHNIPIDHAEWQQVITEIKNKLGVIQQKPRGPKRTAELELLSDAADHCTFMKDIWRNSVSHTRKPYGEPEARAAIDRVRGFMQFVATQLAA